MSGEAKVHLRFKTSSFYHLQGVTAAGKRNESSLLHEAAPSWHLLTSQLHIFCVGRETPVRGSPFSRRDQGMGQVSWQGSWHSRVLGPGAGECSWIHHFQQWHGSCSAFHSALGELGKGNQLWMKPSQNIVLSKQIFPSSGNSLKWKFLPDLYLLQISIY